MDKSKLKNQKINVASFSAITEQDNPDLLKFSAVVGYLNTPTDGTPCGGKSGYKVVLSDNVDIESLVGSGVNCTWADGWFSDGGSNLKGHNPHFKIGVIDKAWLQGNEICVEGHLWKYDFPELCDTIECAKESLGCSVEFYYSDLASDSDNKIMKCSGINFTGLAILYKSKAAFKKTSFMCSILEDKENKGLEKEEVQKIVDEAVSAKFAELAEKQEANINELKDAILKLSESKKEDKVPEKKEMDLSELTSAIVAGVSEALKEKKPAEQTRKTAVNFASVPQIDESNQEKDILKLSAEIDNDNSLTPEEKWSKQLALWNKER